MREPIRLKDDADDLVDYPETRETLRIRRAFVPINAYLKELCIELPGVARQGQNLRIGDSQILPIPGNGLQRIFSREVSAAMVAPMVGGKTSRRTSVAVC
jgi:hypothetical protein